MSVLPKCLLLLDFPGYGQAFRVGRVAMIAHAGSFCEEVPLLGCAGRLFRAQVAQGSVSRWGLPLWNSEGPHQLSGVALIGLSQRVGPGLRLVGERTLTLAAFWKRARWGHLIWPPRLSVAAGAAVCQRRFHYSVWGAPALAVSVTREFYFLVSGFHPTQIRCRAGWSSLSMAAYISA